MHCFSQELDAISPYSFVFTVRNPAGWHWNNPLEIFEKGKIWTALQLSSQKPVGLKLESLGSIDKPRVSAKFFSEQKLTGKEESEGIELVERGAGLREDVTEFYEMSKSDFVLNHAIRKLYGMRRGITLSDHIFNSATLAVTLQNAPITRTHQMLQLLITNYGEKLTFDHITTYTWPSPKTVTDADEEEMTEKCKLGYRTKFLKSIAEAVANRACPSIKELLQMPFKEAKAELFKLKGIGEYSAEVILPHGEAFPIDTWSAQIFGKLFFPSRRPPSKQETIQIVREQAAQRWGSWRKLAFIYVLNDLDYLSEKFKINP
jgi:3-methyladenine DNA glycosylase/8-oxoguanine DNA glycosylase